MLSLSSAYARSSSYGMLTTDIISSSLTDPSMSHHDHFPPLLSPDSHLTQSHPKNWTTPCSTPSLVPFQRLVNTITTSIPACRSSSGAYTQRRYCISLTLTSDKTWSRDDHASTSPRRPACTQPTRTQKIRQHIALHSRWCSRHRRRWILILHPRAGKGRPSRGQGQGRGGEEQAKVSGGVR